MGRKNLVIIHFQPIEKYLRIIIFLNLLANKPGNTSITAKDAIVFTI